jgi:hypothetical protein
MSIPYVDEIEERYLKIISRLTLLLPVSRMISVEKFDIKTDFKENNYLLLYNYKIIAFFEKISSKILNELT